MSIERLLDEECRKQIPPPNLLQMLVDRSDSMIYNRDKSTLEFKFNDLKFFNRYVKPAMMNSFRRPYVIFINYFDELFLQISVKHLFEHVYNCTSTGTSGKIREFVKNSL